jgi:hypothetical protein
MRLLPPKIKGRNGCQNLAGQNVRKILKNIFYLRGVDSQEVSDKFAICDGKRKRARNSGSYIDSNETVIRRRAQAWLRHRKLS